VRHLVHRFFGFLSARPLGPREQMDVSSVLPVPLHGLFYAQSPEDQRHAYEVASRVGDRPDLVVAALMHDVGKSVTRLGAISRSAATAWGWTGLPVWGRWRTYLRHGSIGASMLADAGAPTLAITFAERHPGPVPTDVDADDWWVLATADEA
jgi:hypothetical protein